MKLTEKELNVITINQCPYNNTSDNSTARMIWIQGFKAGYLYKRERQERWKSVDVFYKGALIGNAKSLTEAHNLSGMSNSRICVLVKSKQKSKSGYSFKPGKL